MRGGIDRTLRDTEGGGIIVQQEEGRQLLRQTTPELVIIKVRALGRPGGHVTINNIILKP